MTYRTYTTYRILFVPETGLEPAHVAIPDPKSGASANFATPAKKPEGAKHWLCQHCCMMSIKGTFIEYYILHLEYV